MPGLILLFHIVNNLKEKKHFNKNRYRLYCVCFLLSVLHIRGVYAIYLMNALFHIKPGVLSGTAVIFHTINSFLNVLLHVYFIA